MHKLLISIPWGQKDESVHRSTVNTLICSLKMIVLFTIYMHMYKWSVHVQVVDKWFDPSLISRLASVRSMFCINTQYQLA